ncbi:MAG TPA: protein kinase [Baekduia sp.]
MSALDSELQVGDVFAGHRIVGVAGRGGMGVVYRAEQLDLERPVALKLIASPLARDDDFRERFVRETRAAAAIDHPNVIPVYSAGEEDGRLYLAMRLVDGEDLRTLVQHTGPLAPHRAAAIIAQIGNALDAAHARGLVHRDIKPANVLLDGDHAYLTDFGLTKRLSGETTMTGSGRWVGTLGYIAPEQIRGEPVDARADVYALGCLLFYVLTGVAPYRRDSDEATLYAHLNDPAPDPRLVTTGVPDALAAVIERALAKDPDDRFPSAGDLGRAALAAVGDGPAPPPERLVARGAAAPGGAGAEETAIPGSVTPTEIAPGGPSDPSRIRRWVAPAVSLLAGAAIVLATVLLMSRGDDHRAGAPAETTSTTPLAPGTARAAKPVKVDERPNAIAYYRNRVWTISVRTGRLTGIPADGQGRRRIIKLPWDRGTTSVAAGFGSLWVTNGGQSRLIRIDAVTGKMIGDRLLGDGDAVVVATGDNAVWVARRAVNPSDPPSAIVKVVPKGGQTQEIPFGQEGIADIAVGGGYVWVANHRRARVSRLDPASGHRLSRPVGLGAHRVAYGDGQVWVSNYDDGTITQNTRAMDNQITVPFGQRGPEGIAVSGHTLWVASYLDDTVSRIDTRTGKPIGDPIPVGRNPLSIVAHGKSAWVANVASGSVTRIDVS